MAAAAPLSACRPVECVVRLSETAASSIRVVRLVARRFAFSGYPPSAEAPACSAVPSEATSLRWAWRCAPTLHHGRARVRTLGARDAARQLHDPATDYAIPMARLEQVLNLGPMER